MRLLTLISPARNRTMKKVKMILFVYVAGALTAIAVMMALRGYAPFLFAGAGAVATWLVMRLPTWRRDARKASAAKGSVANSRRTTSGNMSFPNSTQRCQRGGE
jgi:hypothetical protein